MTDKETIYERWHKLFGKLLKKRDIVPKLREVFEDNVNARRQLQESVRCSKLVHK